MFYSALQIPSSVKSLYAILRDAGFKVSTSEHPAFAVQMVIQGTYDFMILDSEPFGLSSEDAAEIIRKISPALQILPIGTDRSPDAVEEPFDLEEFKRTIHSMAV